MTRVAVACRWIDGVTGTTNGIVERTKRLAARGWTVELFGERLDEGRLRAAGGVPRRVRNWPLGSAFKRAWFSRRLDRLARGFDLVEGHGDTLNQDLLVLHNCVHAAHEAIHGTPMPADSDLGRLHARTLSEGRFRVLIANSETMKREVVARFGVAEEKVVVIRPGFDPARFRADAGADARAAARREWGAADGEVLVGLATSGDFKKRGVDLFLKALAALRPEAAAKVRAVVVGKERRTGEFRERARALGLGDRVDFRPVTGAIARFYRALDLFAYPALYEEFGQSVQEAMACGAPTLASARVGAAELLPAAAREFVPERPDGPEWTALLERLILRADDRERLARAGLDGVRGNDWDRNFAATAAVYDRLLKEGEGRA